MDQQISYQFIYISLIDTFRHLFKKLRRDLGIFMRKPNKLFIIGKMLLNELRNILCLLIKF